MLLRLTTTVAAFLVWVPVASAWTWPVQGPVVQPFSYDASHPYAAGQHRGIDIGAPAAGAPVVAPAAGTVTFAGTVPTSGESVTIATADGYSVTLTHLGSFAVARGAAVTEGALVGTVGPSGTPEVAVPYVHLGIRLAADPNGYLDPLSFLPPLAAPPPPDGGATTPAPVSTAPAPKPVVQHHPRATAPARPAAPAVDAAAVPRAQPSVVPYAPAQPAVVPARGGARGHGWSVQAFEASRHALRHRPVPAPAPAPAQPAARRRRAVSVLPLGAGAGAAALAGGALLLLLRRRRICAPEPEAQVIALPQRGDRHVERRAA